jgi:hypothetical protein
VNGGSSRRAGGHTGAQVHGDELLASALTDWHDAVLEIGDLPDEEARFRAWKQDVLNGSFENFTAMYYALLGVLGFATARPWQSQARSSDSEPGPYLMDAHRLRDGEHARGKAEELAG